MPEKIRNGRYCRTCGEPLRGRQKIYCAIHLNGRHKCPTCGEWIRGGRARCNSCRKCETCGKTLTSKQKRFCSDHFSGRGPCPDCGKILEFQALNGKRCHSCANKISWRNEEARANRVRGMRAYANQSGVRTRRSANAKAAWARGVFSTEQWRQKQSEAGKKKMTPEMREYMAQKMRAYANQPGVRAQISAAKKADWVSGAYDGCFQSPTSIEIKTSAALSIAGVEYTDQYRPAGYSRVYDFFIPPNILIECHGDYWHGPKRPKNQKRDIEKKLWAKENGYYLVVLWEHEINELGAWPLIKNRILPLLAEEKV